MPHQVAVFIEMGASLPPITLWIISNRVLTGFVIAIVAISGFAALVSAQLKYRAAMCLLLVIANAYFLFALISPMFLQVTHVSGPTGKH